MSGRTLRVVLASRAAVDPRRLLAEAVALAGALDAELAGLFVEESDLLRAMALPISVEVGHASGSVRPADPESTRRLLTRSAADLRALVAEAAGRSGLAWSFAVTRGDLLREALAAAAAAPVLLAPRRSAVQHAVGQHAVGRTPAREVRTIIAVLEESASLVPTESPRADVRADVRADAPAERAWAAAVRFAAGRPDAPARLRLEELVRGPAPGVLVVPLASVAGRADLLERVLADAGCPVVLVG